MERFSVAILAMVKHIRQMVYTCIFTSANPSSTVSRELLMTHAVIQTPLVATILFLLCGTQFGGTTCAAETHNQSSSGTIHLPDYVPGRTGAILIINGIESVGNRDAAQTTRSVIQSLPENLPPPFVTPQIDPSIESDSNIPISQTALNSNSSAATAEITTPNPASLELIAYELAELRTLCAALVRDNLDPINEQVSENAESLKTVLATLQRSQEQLLALNEEASKGAKELAGMKSQLASLIESSTKIVNDQTAELMKLQNAAESFNAETERQKGEMQRLIEEFQTKSRKDIDAAKEENEATARRVKVLEESLRQTQEKLTIANDKLASAAKDRSSSDKAGVKSSQEKQSSDKKAEERKKREDDRRTKEKAKEKEELEKDDDKN